MQPRCFTVPVSEQRLMTVRFVVTRFTATASNDIGDSAHSAPSVAAGFGIHPLVFSAFASLLSGSRSGHSLHGLFPPTTAVLSVSLSVLPPARAQGHLPPSLSCSLSASWCGRFVLDFNQVYPGPTYATDRWALSPDPYHGRAMYGVRINQRLGCK